MSTLRDYINSGAAQQTYINAGGPGSGPQGGKVKSLLHPTDNFAKMKSLLQKKGWKSQTTNPTYDKFHHPDYSDHNVRISSKHGLTWMHTHGPGNSADTSYLGEGSSPNSLAKHLREFHKQPNDTATNTFGIIDHMRKFHQQ